MIYRPYVSWGVFGAPDATARASYFASWGLLGVAGSVSGLNFWYWQMALED
jgi:hypothetical protein